MTLAYRTGLVLLVSALLAVVGCTTEDRDREELTEGYGIKILEKEIAASVSGQEIDVAFTVHPTGQRAVSGTAQVDLLKLGTTEPVSSAKSPFSLDKSSTKVNVKLSGLTLSSPADLGSYVLRYFIITENGALYGLRSAFMTVTRSGLTVVGNNRFPVGEKGVLRILVTNVGTGEGLAKVPVSVTFTSDSTSGTRTLSSGVTSVTGDFEASFAFTAAEKGAGTIKVSAGAQRSSHSVLIEQERQVLLTTDKPLYQPGQQVHIRALAMKQPRVTPVANESLLLELEDPKGNKLLRKTVKTDAHGIGFYSHKLARLQPLGTYRLRVTMGTTARSKTFRVDRYTLPKFSVSVKTYQGFYKPGATITGQVNAAYFFGKMVKNAGVVLRAMSDVGGKLFSETLGKTDANGKYTFSIVAPHASRVFLVAQVTDTSGAKADGTAAVPITDQIGKLQVIPERSVAVTGQPMNFYVMYTDPAGQPRAGTIQATGAVSGTVTIDNSGLGVLTTTPRCTKSYSSPVTFDDGAGVRSRFYLACIQRALVLSSDKAVYRDGQRATLTITAPPDVPAATIEILQRNATVKTLTVPLKSGKGSATVTTGADLRRTLTIKAHALRGRTVLTDQKLIYVQGADQLTVKVTTDKKTYRPAERAKVTLQVTDSSGRPAPGALGVQVVDEALYALTEVKPGIERSFFFLEQGVIDASKNLSFISPSVLLKTNPAAADQTAARMLFAASGQKTTYPINVNIGDQDVYRARSKSMVGLNLFLQDLQNRFKDKYFEDGGVPEGRASSAQKWLARQVEWRIDSFGVPYTSKVAETQFSLSSAGMDEIWNTSDDLLATFYWRLIRGDDPLNLPGSKKDGGAWGYPDSGYMSRDAGASYADARPMSDQGGGTKGDSGSSSSVTIRNYFPETLYVNPALITDSNGQAKVEMRLADSITNWKMTSIAHTKTGQLGSSLSDITVFQEFFVDTLLPSHFVQNDEVTVPVPVYNYTSTAQKVTVSVTSAGWFTLLDATSKQVNVPARSVTSASFRIRVDKVGTHGFTATGVSATDSDGVQRSVRVLPDGEKHEVMYGGTLRPGKVSHTVTIPSNAIDGAHELFVKVFPGLLAEAMEGLESIFRQPYGCFEQTSSATYPNVLVLQYLKKAGKSSVNIEKKAQGYIDTGYQRLLGFEVNGSGGFSLYGRPQAKMLLTAFGLMEFSDMAKVRYVDPALITRIQGWLTTRQQSSGAFPAPSYSCYRYSADPTARAVMSTAYVAWALHVSGYNGPAISRAVQYVKSNVSSVTNSYVLAVVANALLTISPSDSTATTLLSSLKAKAQVSSNRASWKASGCSMFYGYGRSMTVETTALIASALLLAKDQGPVTGQALRYLTAAKGGRGGWGSTSASVQALRALILSLQYLGDRKADGQIKVSHNGTLHNSTTVTPATADLMRLFDLKSVVKKGTNTVQLDFIGSGELAYQLVGIYYTPVAKPSGSSPLALSVRYDKTQVKVGSPIKVTANISSTDGSAIPTVLVKVGLPPGFDVDLANLTPAKTNNLVHSAELSAPHLVLYLGDVSSTQTISFPMTPSLALKATAPPSLAYPYYTPEYVRFVQSPTVTVFP